MKAGSEIIALLLIEAGSNVNTPLPKDQAVGRAQVNKQDENGSWKSLLEKQGTFTTSAEDEHVAGSQTISGFHISYLEKCFRLTKSRQRGQVLGTYAIRFAKYPIVLALRISYSFKTLASNDIGEAAFSSIRHHNSVVFSRIAFEILNQLTLDEGLYELTKGDEDGLQAHEVAILARDKLFTSHPTVQEFLNRRCTVAHLSSLSFRHFFSPFLPFSPLSLPPHIHIFCLPPPQSPSSLLYILRSTCAGPAL
jgi:hypothetical protein